MADGYAPAGQRELPWRNVWGETPDEGGKLFWRNSRKSEFV
ncbi:hypothetical protein HMPREF9162_0940 [Selenomonas sp. oral taxon 137 str. F0430]|nr:hypothetical protein HMPREF9162_0940 [Selenomonas sp. oral taxon 137 str. F0430]EJP33870.1 hypothetical protein HMPREF1147_0595 [Selenomonas sp. FOBRC9]